MNSLLSSLPFILFLFVPNPKEIGYNFYLINIGVFLMQLETIKVKLHTICYNTVSVKSAHGIKLW
jgi:hypothetical protein